MGCAFLMNPSVILQNHDRIEDVFKARKSQIRMARLLGLMFILKYLTRRLTIGDIRDRCSSLVGCSGAVVLHSPPELAFDIDLPRDYRYAVQQFSAISERK
jgi:hypothetical protein